MTQGRLVSPDKVLGLYDSAPEELKHLLPVLLTGPDIDRIASEDGQGIPIGDDPSQLEALAAACLAKREGQAPPPTNFSK